MHFYVDLSNIIILYSFHSEQGSNHCNQGRFDCVWYCIIIAILHGNYNICSTWFLDIRISTYFQCAVAIPVLSTIIWHKNQLQEMQKRILVPIEHYTSSDSGYGSSRSSDWSSGTSGLSSGYLMPLPERFHIATIPEESSTTSHHSSATSESTAATKK